MVSREARERAIAHASDLVQRGIVRQSQDIAGHFPACGRMVLAEFSWHRLTATRLEADLRLQGFGLWFRVYAGSSFWPRPILNVWPDRNGMTLRFSRDGWSRRNGCPVVGISWRRAR